MNAQGGQTAAQGQPGGDNANGQGVTANLDDLDDLEEIYEPAQQSMPTAQQPKKSTAKQLEPATQNYDFSTTNGSASVTEYAHSEFTEVPQLMQEDNTAPPADKNE